MTGLSWLVESGSIPPPTNTRPSPAPSTPQAAAALPIRRFSDISAEVDGRGPRQWLIRGVWPAGDYGVHGAEPKAGKTWSALDLGVSVASGTPWLGALEIDTAGPVIVFAGEGGDGNIVRRIRAIATSRNLIAEGLPLWICARAPHLSDSAHLAEIERSVGMIKPVLVILDPLYLAAGGANGSDLYAMGALLERPQHICQAAGAALLVVTHYNRSRDLKGAARFTGAGPAEWGRVLIAAEVISRHTDPQSKATIVLLNLEVTGGEVPEQSFRIRRTIVADDPDDLDSPLTYAVDMPDANDGVQIGPPGYAIKMPPAAAKLLDAVNSLTEPSTIAQIVDRVQERHGHGLKRPTCSTNLNLLRDRGLIDCLDLGAGRERLWHALATEPEGST